MITLAVWAQHNNVTDTQTRLHSNSHPNALRRAAKILKIIEKRADNQSNLAKAASNPLSLFPQRGGTGNSHLTEFSLVPAVSTPNMELDPFSRFCRAEARYRRTDLRAYTD